MEMRQIEHFLAVAHEMSFSRATERAHVVQSALSASIAKLERELGTPLFDRSRQQIRLTAAGERFRTHAYEVLRATRAAAESVSEFRGTLSGTVEFGSLISFGPLNIARALGEFRRANPHVRLRLRLSQAGASAYLAALAEGSLDLALVSAPHRFPPQLDMRLLFEEPMVFVCPAAHPLAARGRIGISETTDEEIVGYPPEFGLRRLMDEAFHAAGARPRTQYEVTDGFATVADLVRYGLGTAFMPRSEAQRFPELRQVELTTPVIWRVYLASPPIGQMMPAAQHLADALLDAAARTE
ncbi:DNA-binding transcriptional LysR family regulator [Nocardia sp. GAS34]|uniref:LysR family transcriptional regulator n=1 Tax=unclassified Nocardia TaxID=2637762 RepID=UPI003D197F04